MDRIRLLDEKISSRIAAGEVVVNPAAAVKELVENSIDAGADAITVEITDGGRKLIRVTDNGSGVVAEDVPLMIQKHATSKISSVADLGNIHTLGFRGEALSSMAAVSRFTVQTRIRDSISGMFLTVSGGGKAETLPAGLPEGTTIKVENLFYNVPARRKFLKGAGAETAKVTSVVAKMILANPGVSFRYLNNGKQIYQSPGNGSLRDALIVVYGKDIADKIKEVSYDDGYVRIDGYLSKPAVLYKTSANISFFLNNRYFQSKAVQNALMEGYGERILRSHFPFAALVIHLAVDSVDVNVHPNKLQLLFFQEQRVLEAIQNAVRQTLSENAPPAIQPSSFKTPASIENPTTPSQAHKPLQNRLEHPPENEQEPLRIPDIRSADRLYQKPAQKAGNSAAAIMPADIPDMFADSKGLDRVMNGILSDSRQHEAAAQSQMEIADVRRLKDYRILGQAFDTYLICESGDNLYLIDQHAAHERLTYERMKNDIETGERYAQMLLVPTVKQFSQEDFDRIGQNMGLLNDLGFEMEEFGPLTYRICALPATADPVQIDALVDDILFEINRKKDIVLLRDKVIRAACRHSVKAGTQLSDLEIGQLIGEITSMEEIPTCPHGRPIAVVLTKADLQKGFKRTV